MDSVLLVVRLILAESSIWTLICSSINFMHLKMRSRMCGRYALFDPKESIRKIEDEPRHRYRLFKSFCKTDLHWKENHKPA